MITMFLMEGVGNGRERGEGVSEVVGVEANIAEGYALGAAPSYLRHLNISIGPLAETECHVQIAYDLSYCADQAYQEIDAKAREVGYLLSRLKSSIETNSHQGPHKP